MLTWIKPQKSFAEAGVRTRSSLSMCQWSRERNFSILCKSLNTKVLYKPNLICELIGVGKPGQRYGEIELCGFPGTPLPKRSSFIWIMFLWPAGQVFTPSLCQDCCVILVKVYFDTTADGVTYCTTAKPTFLPPWEALVRWPRALPPNVKGAVGTWAMAVVLHLRSIGCWMFPPYCTLQFYATHAEKLVRASRVTQKAATHAGLDVSGKQMFQWAAKNFVGGVGGFFFSP